MPQRVLIVDDDPLLDLHMPNPDGSTLLRRLSKVRDNAGYLPVIVLTADNDKAARDTALELEGG